MMSDTVLLITSAQNDLLAPTGKAWGFVQATVEANRVPEKLGRLAEAARRAGIPVIHSPVAFDYEAMAGFEPLSAIQKVILDNRLLAAGDAGAEFIPEASPQRGDIVLRARQGFSSFWARTVDGALAELGVTTIYLAGMLAEGCIGSHARDAVENGYRPIVVADAIGSTSPELLEASHRELALHAHALPTTDEVIALWGAAGD